MPLSLPLLPDAPPRSFPACFVRRCSLVLSQLPPLLPSAHHSFLLLLPAPLIQRLFVLPSPCLVHLIVRPRSLPSRLCDPAALSCPPLPPASRRFRIPSYCTHVAADPAVRSCSPPPPALAAGSASRPATRTLLLTRLRAPALHHHPPSPQVPHPVLLHAAGALAHGARGHRARLQPQLQGARSREGARAEGACVVGGALRSCSACWPPTPTTRCVGGPGPRDVQRMAHCRFPHACLFPCPPSLLSSPTHGLHWSCSCCGAGAGQRLPLDRAAAADQRDARAEGHAARAALHAQGRLSLLPPGEPAAGGVCGCLGGRGGDGTGPAAGVGALEGDTSGCTAAGSGRHPLLPPGEPAADVCQGG